MTVSSTTTKNSYSGNASTTTFAYGFKIFAATDLTVILRSATGAETVQTLTTHYTVSNVGVDSGGNVVFGSAPASGVTVVIRRNMALTQSTDYVANDPFPAATHEDALDRLTFISQQMQEESDRSIKLSRTNTMTSTEFTTSATDRANKVLSFDGSGELAVTQELGTYKGTSATTTTAAFIVRDIVKSTTTAQLNNVYICVAASAIGDVLTDTDHFELIVDAVSAAASATTATTKASEAATSATNAAASYDSFDDRYLGAKGSDPSVDNDGASLITGALYFKTDGSGMKVYNGSAWKDVNPSDAELANIVTLAGISDEIEDLAAAAVITDMGLLATSAVIEDMGLLATSAVIEDMGLLATSTVIEDMGLLATSTVIEDMGLLGTSANVTAMGVLGTSDNVTAMGKLGNDATVADMAILATDAIVADMAQLANTTIIDDLAILATSAIVDDMALLATSAVIEDMGLLATSTVIEDMGLLATSAVIEDMGLLGVAAVIEDMALLGVAGVIEDMGILGTSANVTAMSNVSGSIANVNTVATNIASVNNFADVYRIASSAPSASLTAGDLYFNTSTNVLNVYGDSGWQNAGSSVNGTSQRYHYDIGSAVTSVTGSDANSNTLAYDAGYVDVYVNGVRMSTADVTVTSGDTVTFAEALASGDEVDIVAYGTFSVASLNADNLDSGTVPTARVAGAYTGITSVGTLTGFTSTGIDDNADATAITIDSAEKVGIGISNPSSYDDGADKLVVGSTSGRSGITIVSSTSNDGSINFADGTSGTASYMGFINYHHNTNTMKLATNAGTRLTIDSNGNLLVTDGSISSGVTHTFNLFGATGTGGSPAYVTYSFVGDPNTGMYSGTADTLKFATAGSEKIRISAGGGLYIATTANIINTDAKLIVNGKIDAVTVDQPAIDIARTGAVGAIMHFRKGGGTIVGSISINASATAYNTSSDYRLKENVVTDWDATTRLKQLKPSRFNFITEADTTVDGFLAHEVQDIVPEAITGTKDAVDADGNAVMQGIDQSKLVPLLVKTIQELEARITALEGA